MTRALDLPTPRAVRDAINAVVTEAHAAGRRPSVLAVARRLGLTNTTFRRNYPDAAAELSTLRHSGPEPAVPNNESAIALRQRIAELRQDNLTLTTHLELAIANIQRLTIDNHRLRQELEALRGIATLNERRTNRPQRKR
jgi:hypothetical protein